MALFKKPRPDKMEKMPETMTKHVGQTTMVLKLQDKILFNAQLSSITNKIHSSPNLDAILLDLKDDIMSLMKAERITIYAIAQGEKEIYSKIKVGEDIKEFRVAIDNTSIAGYVAKNKVAITIKDAYDLNELSIIDSKLSFNRDFDLKSGFRTKQVLAAPIIFGKRLMGVIQLINKKNDIAFHQDDIMALTGIAETLAIAFHNQTRIHKRQLSKYDSLIAENIIFPAEIEKATLQARETGESMDSVLMTKFKVPKKDIGRAISSFYKIPFFEFTGGMPIPSELISDLDANYLRSNLWVPIKQEGNVVFIAIENPKNLEKVDDIKRQIKSNRYKFMVGIKEDILKTIDYFLGSNTIEVDIEEDDDFIKELKGEFEDPELENEEEVHETDNAIIRIVNKIIIDSYKMGASDIHIEPGMGNVGVKIRVRIDGKCKIIEELPAGAKRAVVSRIKIMAGMDIAERRKPQDGKIQFKKFGKLDIELRVATVPTVGGNEDVVMRILASSKPIPLDKMGMSPRNYKEFTNMIIMPYGIVLVVGPTGSGKTTTLHSALGFINEPDIKIWTAEDPVEITQEGLRQVQVHSKIGFTFANTMRAFLRADPDVIMVGEMRDFETASIGIEASLTGHLVFSTLHTNSAPETVVRLLDMGIDPFNFADALIGVLAQRLVRTLCKECKEAYHPSEADFAELVEEYGEEDFQKQNIFYDEDFTMYKAKGCSICNDLGYKGRMGIHELLAASDPIRKLILRKETAEVIRKLALKEGMTTLKQDGIIKVIKGHTDLKQVRSVCIK